ncbi:MAG TPA: BON domain-containing protein [Terriglobales bacterium]|nr:BON domain-containing protein [Terriglobales bacterium]
MAGVGVWLLAAVLAAGPGQTAVTEQTAQENLRATILQTLINDPELGQYALAASVDGESRVVLNGALPSKQDKELATKLVKSIAGVKSVDNQIQVSAAAAPLAGVAPAGAATPAATPNAPPSDADVQAAVQNALRAQPELAGVTATVSEDQVTLTGTVASEAAREAAVAVAKKNAAGMGVVDRVRVKRP